MSKATAYHEDKIQRLEQRLVQSAVNEFHQLNPAFRNNHTLEDIVDEKLQGDGFKELRSEISSVRVGMLKAWAIENASAFRHEIT